MAQEKSELKTKGILPDVVTRAYKTQCLEAWFKPAEAKS
jgi:SOS response regulatory protein OraA/RecX